MAQQRGANTFYDKVSQQFRAINKRISCDQTLWRGNPSQLQEHQPTHFIKHIYELVMQGAHALRENIPHELYSTVQYCIYGFLDLEFYGAVGVRARGWGGPSIVVWPTGGSQKETIKELKNSSEADDFLM